MACFEFFMNMMDHTAKDEIFISKIGFSDTAMLHFCLKVNRHKNNIHIQRTKPCEVKVLTGGKDLRESQLDVPLSVSYSCV